MTVAYSWRAHSCLHCCGKDGWIKEYDAPHLRGGKTTTSIMLLLLQMMNRFELIVDECDSAVISLCCSHKLYENAIVQIFHYVA